MTRHVVRSMLFAPADNPEVMRKALDTEADACIFDLEDAVPKDKQEEARANLLALAEEGFGDTVVYTRIEDTDTRYWLEDLRTGIEAGVDGVAIPKVESTRDVALVTETARQMTATPPEFRLGIESPAGIFAGTEIANLCADLPEVTGIGFGAADYCREIGAPDINDRVKEFMSHLIIGYASMGEMTGFASGTLEIDNLERLRTLLERQRELGFVGASCIHPKQVATINDVFTPAEEEYEQAKKLVEKYDAHDGDSLVVDGVFLDTATADRYRDIVDRYERVQEST